MFSELVSQRLKLTKINKSGLLEMYEYSKNPLLYTYLEFTPQKTLEETNKYLQKLINRNESENNFYWFIRLRETDKIIGTFGVINIDWRKKDAEIGYGISPEHWNKGYFKEVLEIILEELFVTNKFHRICAKSQSDNYPSIKGLKSAGFEEEGTMREYYYSSGKKRHDAIMLSILEKDYDKKTR